MRLRTMPVQWLLAASLAGLVGFVPLGRGGNGLRAAETVVEKDVEFSNPDEQHLKLNLARPKEASGKLPAVLCIHGGGFRAGRRERWDGMCQKLAEQGYLAVTIDYRLAPKFPFPAAIHDCKAAVRWLRASADKYHLDPDRIGVLGDSAGGHLAQYLGVTGDEPTLEGTGGSAGFSTRVKCVVNYYGPSDLTRSYGKSVDAGEVLPLFFGGGLEQKRHEHIVGSPLYWVSPRSAPTLLIHGTEDKYVNFEQAQWIHERLKAADVEVELLKLDGAGHGFKGPDAERAEKAALDFLARHLKK